MEPVIYNNAEEQIIQQLKAAGLYETFMAQVNRAAPCPNEIFILCDKAPNRCVYYIYHRGFSFELDNGFSSITIENAENRPEVVKAVERALERQFTSEIKMLWRNNPQRRN